MTTQSDSGTETLCALRRIGAHDELLAAAGDQVRLLRRVTEARRDQVLLHDGTDEHPARILPALAQLLRRDGETLAVGDWVSLEPDPAGALWVGRQWPSARQVARRVSDGNGGLRRQVLVSHVDQAVLVMGLDHDFNLRRLERYLVLARGAGIGAVVVLSKADLVAPDLLERRVQAAQGVLPADVPVLALDGRSADAGRRLEAWLPPGRTAVLLGSSGAGKSTLTNTLMGAALQDTGPNRSGDSRGRHTTTARTLHLLPGGGCLIDTPGLRALRLDLDEPGALDAVFTDVAEAALRCRFRNCRHQGEPGCAVVADVPEDRVRNWHKLQREARHDSMTMLERQEQLRVWKLRGRAGHQRAKAKRSGHVPG